jgi:hypothetical protein
MRRWFTRARTWGPMIKGRPFHISSWYERQDDGQAYRHSFASETNRKEMTNVVEIQWKWALLVEILRVSTAHNGLVAGSSPAGPTNKIGHFLHGWKRTFYEPPQIRC